MLIEINPIMAKNGKIELECLLCFSGYNQSIGSSEKYSAEILANITECFPLFPTPK